MPRLRPRISLLAALLLMTVAGMAIVIFLQWRELGPLRREARQMRAQLGRLSIDDPSRVHAIEVRQPDSNLWRWRIYLPPRGKYKLLEFGGLLPARGALSNYAWLDLMKKGSSGGGEYSGSELNGEFTLEATFTLQDGRWKFKTHPGGGESQYVLAGNWPAESGRVDASDVWEDQQRVYEQGKPILLLWLPQPVNTPALGGGVRSESPKQAAEGVALWLEQQPSPRGATTNP